MGSRSLKRRPGVKKRRPIAGVLSVLAVVLAVGGAMTFGVLFAVGSWFEDLPDYRSPDAFSSSKPTYVYASDRETVLARFQLEYREPVEMDQISPYLVDAVLAVEDARFYEHPGIDAYGVVRALVNNLRGGNLEGASTITQQLVRNTVLAGEMDEISIRRKAREAYLALELEKMYSKDDILLAYLNTVNFGAGAYGIEAAAQRYFSKPASELTLAESALLAGIPQSPTYNDPLQYPVSAENRRSIVLQRMLSEHVITEEEYRAADASPIELNPKEMADDGILAYPYFTSYVRYLLYNDYGLTDTDILKGGLSVYTTLDVDRQEAAEEAAERKRNSLRGSMEVAIAMVEPSTGNIQALVGGSDYEESEVNLATGQGGGGRPCGSTFKVFTLVEAIKRGIDPNSTYLDCTSPATVDGYTLTNINNVNYGTQTIAGALAVSSNTGFVRLISSLGVDAVANTAHDLGVTADLHEQSAGATLTLGVENVTPLEMANAFATIANGGVRHDACAIATIEDSNGNVIVDATDPDGRAERVLTPEQAHAAQEAMKTVVRSGTGTEASLWNGQPVAGKTGTSENYKDITFTGITPQFSVSIWVGDPSNEQSVPVGSCADVFSQVVGTIMGNEGMAVEQFAEVDNPPYTPYNDQKYHITSGGYSYYYGSQQDYGYQQQTQGQNNNSDEEADSGDDDGSYDDDGSGAEGRNGDGPSDEEQGEGSESDGGPDGESGDGSEDDE